MICWRCLFFACFFELLKLCRNFPLKFVANSWMTRFLSLASAGRVYPQCPIGICGKNVVFVSTLFFFAARALFTFLATAGFCDFNVSYFVICSIVVDYFVLEGPYVVYQVVSLNKTS